MGRTSGAAGRSGESTYSLREAQACLDALAIAVRGDFGADAGSARDVARVPWTWFRERYRPVIVRGFRKGLGAYANELTEDELWNEYWLYLCTNRRYQRYIYDYWVKNGSTEDVLNTALFKTAVWTGQLIARTRARNRIVISDTPIENVPNPASITVVDLSAWGGFCVTEFCVYVAEGYESKSDSRRRASALLMFRYFNCIRHSAEIEPVVERTYEFCTASSGIFKVTIVEEVIARSDAILKKEQRLRKQRKHGDLPGFAYEDIARWLGVTPDPLRGYNTLHAATSKACKALRAHLEAARDRFHEQL